MHSHDRTLISSLGFADKDKKDTRHDLAIQYLMQPDKARAVADQATRGIRERLAFDQVEGHPEVRLTKGEGKYETTIGFADLVINCRVARKLDVHERRKEHMAGDLKNRQQKIESRWWIWRSQQLGHPEERDSRVTAAIDGVTQTIDWFLENGAEVRRDGPDLLVDAAGLSEDECAARLIPWKPVLLTLLAHYPLSKRMAIWQAEDEMELNLKWGSRDHRGRAVATAVIDHMSEDEQDAESEQLMDVALAYYDQAIGISWKTDHWVDEATGLHVYGVERSTLLEIKIQPVPTGDILRQFALYSAHIRSDKQFLVTAFDLAAEDIDALKTKHIEHLRLGKSFDDYCDRRKNSPQQSLSLEI